MALRILVIEDDPVTSALVRSRLTDDGHLVMAVDSAESALVTVATLGCPDVAVVDIDLPGKDGVDLVAELREHACPHAPGVVFVSAQPPPTEESLETFLQKPVLAAELLAAVRQAAGSTRAEISSRACSRMSSEGGLRSGA